MKYLFVILSFLKTCLIYAQGDTNHVLLKKIISMRCLFSVTVIFVGTFLGCRNDDFFVGDKMLDYHVKIDTPSTQSYIVDFLDQVNRRLELPPIKKGFDSIQIRIWFFSDGELPKTDLIILKNNKSWKGIHYCFNLKDYEFYDTAKLENINKKQLFTDQWNQLMKTLMENNFKKLPDYSVVNNYPLVSVQRAGITIEFADVNQYRLYSYIAPIYFQDKLVEQHQIRNIITAICSTFSLKEIRKSMLGN